MARHPDTEGKAHLHLQVSFQDASTEQETAPNTLRSQFRPEL